MVENHHRKMAAENEAAGGRRKKRSICCFLLSLLADDSYPHVQWTDKEKGEFAIHWKHASSGAWVIDNDAETFRLWAKAKGKLQGREANYKTWKANFRCAMKSRHELQEIPLPEGSAYRRKNVKLWRFVDMEIVNKFEVEGERFDWNRSQTQPNSRRSVRTTRTRRSRRAMDVSEKTDSNDGESFHPSLDSCERESSLSQPGSSSTALAPVQRSEELNCEQPLINMEDDTDFSTYGAGLLQILEQEKETDCVVPNMLTESFSGNLLTEYDLHTETTAFTQDKQLPSFHSFMEESPISEDIQIDEEWHLFGDQEYSSHLKGEGITRIPLDIPWSDTENREDPFVYESTYVEL